LKLPGVPLSLHCVPFPETVPYFCVSVQGFTPLRLRSSIKSNCYELSGAIFEGEWREQIPRAVGKHPTAPNSGLQPDGHFVAFRRAKRWR